MWWIYSWKTVFWARHVYFCNVDIYIYIQIHIYLVDAYKWTLNSYEQNKHYIYIHTPKIKGTWFWRIQRDKYTRILWIDVVRRCMQPSLQQPEANFMRNTLTSRSACCQIGIGVIPPKSELLQIPLRTHLFWATMIHVATIYMIYSVSYSKSMFRHAKSRQKVAFRTSARSVENFQGE